MVATLWYAWHYVLNDNHSWTSGSRRERRRIWKITSLSIQGRILCNVVFEVWFLTLDVIDSRLPLHIMSSLAGPSRSRPQDHVTSDADMLALLAQLTLADIEEIENRQKGKQRQGAPMTDAELALSLMAEDARSLEVFNSDHALARRLAQSESDFAERRLPRGPPIVSPARSVSIGSTQSTRPTPGSVI